MRYYPLTLAETVEKHKELWQWVAENPHQSKYHWPGWDELEEKYPDMEIIASCFGCTHAESMLIDADDEDGVDSCDYCIFDWPGEEHHCRELFNKHLRASLMNKPQFALELANVPVKPWVEFFIWVEEVTSNGK